MYASLVSLILCISSHSSLLVTITAFICRPLILFRISNLCFVDDVWRAISVGLGFSFVYIVSHTSVPPFCLAVWYTRRSSEGTIRRPSHDRCTSTAAPLSRDPSPRPSGFVISSPELKTNPSCVKAGPKRRTSRRSEQNDELVSANKSSTARGTAPLLIALLATSSVPSR